MDEVWHTHVNENADSIELGTPAKGGAIKIYGDFGRPEEFEKKINAAINVLVKARETFTAQVV